MLTCIYIRSHASSQIQCCHAPLRVFFQWRPCGDAVDEMYAYHSPWSQVKISQLRNNMCSVVTYQSVSHSCALQGALQKAVEFRVILVAKSGEGNRAGRGGKRGGGGQSVCAAPGLNIVAWLKCPSGPQLCQGHGWGRVRGADTSRHVRTHMYYAHVYAQMHVCVPPCLYRKSAHTSIRTYM